MGSMTTNPRDLEPAQRIRDLFTDNRVPITKARDNLGAIASQVAYGNSHIMLTKGHEYMAVMVPIGWYLDACKPMGHEPATGLDDPWSALVTRSPASTENEYGEAIDVEGELKVHGLSIGHGCNQCFELRISPAVVHGTGASYHPVIQFTAGHGGERGRVGVRLEDIPAVIAELQRLLAEAGDGSSLPDGWPAS